MMNMTDPIADMLTRVRNALGAKHETVQIPSSREKVEIARILKEEGFIVGYSVSEDLKKVLTVELKYAVKGAVDSPANDNRRDRVDTAYIKFLVMKESFQEGSSVFL